ncbi:thiamine phosphate synthase [Thiomicrorhabdus sp. ZW0627]|uniref:thiamine phosphate synthase n=1 Tax=Thiomicrorhabdus sp. ZW0627 TaxID=3039774 RepID=UPI0024367BAC|nr:thiamine phosphate synthase [Thiomicrorhabdus sp. ZW0627]MDG6774747.1 thiamine phosphate synthase [Thiomicrorhabdus sp. ZW0627]
MAEIQSKRPIIWSIAGSDCSGGAGIQADIKSGHAIGCEVCTLITANTVQNSRQLQSINSVPVDLLQQQFDCLLEDKPPQAVKIGLIANNQQLDWLVKRLKTLKQNSPGLVVVLDPVMKASVGQDLVVESIGAGLFDELLKIVDIVTPNHSEAASLAEDDEQQHTSSEWAERILHKGCQAVVITGGHGESEQFVTDNCYFEDQHLALKSPRTATGYGHGSGCSLSTAIAGFMAQGYLLRDAFIQAQAFTNKAFSLCPKDLKYYGALIQPYWPVEKQFYPQVVLSRPLESVSQSGFADLGIQKPGLYPVVDSVEWLEKLMPLGIEIIQLRLKNKTENELCRFIEQAVVLSKQYPTRLFINDYWQLAIEYGAYGVHLGQEDLQALSAEEIQIIQKSGIRLGISTHGSYEFLLAQQIKPSYLAIGAIFPTRTKDMTGQIQGVDNLREILKLKTGIPVVAIGGITLQNAPDVISTQVDSIAVVTAITLSTSPEKVVEDFKHLLS